MSAAAQVRLALSELHAVYRERRNELLGLWLMGFVVLSSYALARPAAESLFLQAYSSSALPWAWLGVAVAAALVVGLYNRAARRRPIHALLSLALLASAGTLVLLLVALRLRLPGAPYLVYVWKDVYIVVLVEIFWTFANCAFAVKTARLLYGTFSMAGALGGIFGNLAIGRLAAALGTETALMLVAPVLGAAWAGSLVLVRPSAAPERQPAAMQGGLRTLVHSRFLLLLLALIGTVQLAVNLIDFQFNVAVEAAFADVDARTHAIGVVYAAIEATALVLALLTSAILRFAGVSATLLFIPAALGSAVLALLVAPGYATAAVAKVASKAFDYSLFRAGREILYIPLSYAEKTQGKALIDIFAYRLAKGGASLVVLLLRGAGALSLLGVVTSSLVAVWLALTVAITARHRAMVQGSAAPAQALPQRRASV